MALTRKWQNSKSNKIILEKNDSKSKTVTVMAKVIKAIINYNNK